MIFLLPVNRVNIFFVFLYSTFSPSVLSAFSQAAVPAAVPHIVPVIELMVTAVAPVITHVAELVITVITASLMVKRGVDCKG